MLKEIVRAHKAERDKLIKSNYIPREGLEKARMDLSAQLVKIITGPRRAGKSVFAIEILKETDFAYLNFDDERLLNIIDNDLLIKHIHEIYGKTKYLLFDEIQNLDQWELFINRLQRAGYNIILTGSNSRLLSREMATHLTGRFIPHNLYTFSFAEFLIARGIKIAEQLPQIEQGEILHLLYEYQSLGGYPEIIVNHLEPGDYLRILFNSIIFKDVVRRYNIRYSQSLYDLALFLVSNYAREFSYTKLKNLTQIGSVHTIQNYVSYLEEAYLLFSVKRFSFKPKEQLKTPAKIYVYDTGLATSLRLTLSQDLGRLMENRVSTELMRRQKEFYYYKDATGMEVDFIIKEKLKLVELIQVCYDVSNPNTKKREIKSLIKAGHQLKINTLTIITWDYEKEESANDFPIHFIPLWKWLLE